MTPSSSVPSSAMPTTSSSPSSAFDSPSEMIAMPDRAYLELLAQQYPSVRAVSKAIIDLRSRLDLPKETEHFLSDIHGEYEAFRHLLRNGSGSVRRKVEQTFGYTLSQEEMSDLCTLIYYPERKLPRMLKTVSDAREWCRTALYRLIRVARVVAAKYTRADVRRHLPKDLTELLEELLLEQEEAENKKGYYQGMIEAILDTGRAPDIITILARLIQRLAVARLHILGDIFDRGPFAHRILDTLIEYDDVDITWGNHDILWMGAAAGHEACIANVVRICLRYANVETLENGYGISLLPLASFALETYGDDPCSRFQPAWPETRNISETEKQMIARMHKAIVIIQFKLEAAVIRRRPHYRMENRLLLDKIDFSTGTVTIEGKRYPLLDTHLPTVNPQDPYVLTAGEEAVTEKLRLDFLGSEALQRHVRFLFSKGSMYRIHNGDLLYHGCIAMNEDGTFRGFEVEGQSFTGKRFMDRLDRLARQGYFAVDNLAAKLYGMDAMWYLWCGDHSPLYGKDKMATFERYFLADPQTHKETQNPYYHYHDREETVRTILTEFGLDPDRGHIINGHVPVKVKKGERPVKANGRLIVIDGGFCRAYQKETGIAGYTLVSNADGLLLAAHKPFQSAEDVIEKGVDMESTTITLERAPGRRRIRDTDRGREMEHTLIDLSLLLSAYRQGILHER